MRESRGDDVGIDRAGRITVEPDLSLPGDPRVLALGDMVRVRAADGTITVARSDIYGGRVIPFVPFTALAGDAIKGTHNQ